VINAPRVRRRTRQPATLGNPVGLAPLRAGPRYDGSTRLGPGDAPTFSRCTPGATEGLRRELSLVVLLAGDHVQADIDPGQLKSGQVADCPL